MFLCGCLETWKLCSLEKEGMQQWRKLERNTQSWNSPPPLYESKQQVARSLALPSSSFACTCPGCSSHGRALASSGDSWSDCSPTSAAPVPSSLQIVSGVAGTGWWCDFKRVSLKQSETARKISCSFACVYAFHVLLLFHIWNYSKTTTVRIKGWLVGASQSFKATASDVCLLSLSKFGMSKEMF